MCHAGRVEIVLPPQLLQRSLLPVSGTVRVSGRRSTLTSAERPQLAHAAMTERTPFKRMLPRVMGGPGLERMVRVEDELEAVLDFYDRDAFDP